MTTLTRDEILEAWAKMNGEFFRTLPPAAVSAGHRLFEHMKSEGLTMSEVLDVIEDENSEFGAQLRALLTELVELVRER